MTIHKVRLAESYFGKQLTNRISLPERKSICLFGEPIEAEKINQYIQCSATFVFGGYFIFPNAAYFRVFGLFPRLTEKDKTTKAAASDLKGTLLQYSTKYAQNMLWHTLTAGQLPTCFPRVIGLATLPPPSEQPWSSSRYPFLLLS